MKHLTNILLSSLFFGLLNGAPDPSRTNVGERIIGGEPARGGQFPFAAAIYASSSSGTFFCSGALLSNHWILTAAQCIYTSTQFTIYLGSNSLSGTDPNRLTLATSSFVVHPNFDPNTLAHDVGLIRLRLPIEYNDYVLPIRLPEWEVSDLAAVTAIGWGQNSDHNSGLVNELQFVELITISNSECRANYGNQIFDDMICAIGQVNEGICTGDSGGPLIEYRTTVMAVHVAIASFHSSQGCESTLPSGYTRTYAYVDWIRNVTEIAN